MRLTFIHRNRCNGTKPVDFLNDPLFIMFYTTIEKFLLAKSNEIELPVNIKHSENIVCVLSSNGFS